MHSDMLNILIKEKKNKIKCHNNLQKFSIAFHKILNTIDGVKNSFKKSYEFTELLFIAKLKHGRYGIV